MEESMASIASIVYQPEGQAYDDLQSNYLRVPLQRAQLIAGQGIQGDQKGGHHPDRQLNLISQEWLQMIQPLGYRTGPGQFGEQIILSGLAVESLPPGTRLQFGKGTGTTAVIEIVKARTGCTRLEAAQGKSIDGLGPIGVLARVISGGTIEIEDPVTVLETVI
jgi:MOSC domain-containing protein YiiM